MQAIVSVLLDTVDHNRKGVLPYVRSSTDSVKEKLPWFPTTVIYRNPKEMNQEEALSIIRAAIESCSEGQLHDVSSAVRNPTNVTVFGSEGKQMDAQTTFLNAVEQGEGMYNRDHA